MLSCMLMLVLMWPSSSSVAEATGNLSNPNTEFDLQNGNVLRVPFFVYLWGGLYAALYASAVGRRKRSVDNTENNDVFALMDNIVQELDLSEDLEAFEQGREDWRESDDILSFISRFMEKFELADIFGKSGGSNFDEDHFSADYNNDFDQREIYYVDNEDEDVDDEKDCFNRFICEMGTGKILSSKQFQWAKQFMEPLHVRMIEGRLSSLLSTILTPSSLAACRAKHSQCPQQGLQLMKKMAPKIPSELINN